MNQPENNENLTPRQRERREMAARRRRREKRNMLILVGLLVVLAILVTVLIVHLSRGIGKDDTPSREVPTDSIQIPDSTDDSEPVSTGPDETGTEPLTTDPEDTEPITEPEDTQDAEPATEPEDTQTTEPTTMPSAEVDLPAYEDQLFFPDSDKRYITYDDYKNLTLWELVLARNEIFARHGRKFDDKDIQAYFNGCDWYEGTLSPSQFDSSVLNEYELQNIRTLKAASDARQGR